MSTNAASEILAPSLHQRADARGAANGHQPTQGIETKIVGGRWRALQLSVLLQMSLPLKLQPPLPLPALLRPASWQAGESSLAVRPNRKARASLAEVLDTLFELTQGQPSEAQSHVVVELILLDGHGISSPAGHLALGLHPHEVAALWLEDLQAHLAQLLADQRAALAEVLADHREVLGHRAGLEEVDEVARGEDDRIVPAVNVADAGERFQELLVGLDPANLDAGADELREGADGEHVGVLGVVVVEEGLDVAGLELEQLVGLVG
eukprot:CAMPEP_0203971968 /NCGR_PEP_ID=MMETSP0359-20131031/98768_1 /ASSEMBLY_ACC=CAM_ASM_000338 /TAXON_ID=268821 /ORGANISM="Scrippsiella Hangoei, Strain SHTV-5" /LENGTH=265 /DNA_ID=CAMNT_0050909993 /DNA_START=9 /DNA_END=802 /DNA_ORIENTATION=+